MTAPRHRFGAHERKSALRADAFHCAHNLLKLFGQHEIRVSAKGGDSPAGIRRVGRGFSKAAEIAAPKVVDAARLERRAERFAVEPRVAARRRPAAHVDQKLDRMSVQKLNQYFAGASRMADGVDG